MLSSDELTTLHDWIDGQQALNGRPWAEEAEACGNDLVAENQHIQRLVIIPHRHKHVTDPDVTAK